MNSALQQLLVKHGAGAQPLPTSLDLYRELKAVTPQSLQYLLHDLFAANTFWDLATVNAAAVQTASGAWKVTIDVRAGKEVVDEWGNVTPLPMNDWIEIGVVGATEKGKERGKDLYLQKHLIVRGHQTITVTVPGKPAVAGIDPNHLLIDLRMTDNTKTVKQ